MAEVSAAGVVPEVEVAEKAARRQFNAEYKRKILKEADACTREGEIGALLRREGLYSSHLSVWRAARERGEIAVWRRGSAGPRSRPRTRETARSWISSVRPAGGRRGPNGPRRWWISKKKSR